MFPFTRWQLPTPWLSFQTFNHHVEHAGLAFILLVLGVPSLWIVALALAFEAVQFKWFNERPWSCLCDLSQYAFVLALTSWWAFGAVLAVYFFTLWKNKP